MSTDNALLHLGVSGYQIEPAFSASVYNYTLTVPYTAEIVNVVASANEKATIFGRPHGIGIGETARGICCVRTRSTGRYLYLGYYKNRSSSDNTLKSLTVLRAAADKYCPLQPAFKPQITDYIIQLEEDSDIHTIEILRKPTVLWQKAWRHRL